MQWIAYVLVPLVISFVLTPLVNKIALKLDIYAHVNERTVHHGKIARIGGIAIYLAFIIGMTIFTNGIDITIAGLLIGSFIMFMGGLIDDILDIPPLVKLAIELVAAFVLIWVGHIELGVIHLPLGLTINTGVISILITLIWIVGITNAINLIDGLDGLAGGVSAIVLLAIAAISFIENRSDIGMISFILAGAIGGFLYFNMHPAKIFMGDCGALFLGFVISAISLMGFKGSTFITLGFPILLLSVPIIDTLSAMLRRTLGGKKFTEADRNHLHHVLMRRFGHAKTVYIIYAITMAFGISAYLYVLNKKIGLIMVLILFIGLEIFIERTHMISYKYHPIMSFYHMITKKDISELTDMENPDMEELRKVEKKDKEKEK